VNVRIKVLRHVVVYNVRNTLHVDTPCCDIGSDKDTIATIFKAVQRLLSLSLGKIPVQGCDVLTSASELLSKTLCGVLHLSKHNNEGLSILLEPMRQYVRLR
jgi:ABC-type enterochelin transport system ATPase subunit